MGHRPPMLPMLDPDVVRSGVKADIQAAAEQASVKAQVADVHLKTHALGTYAHMSVQCNGQGMVYSAHLGNLADKPGYLIHVFRDWFLTLKGATDGEEEANASDASQGQGKAQADGRQAQG